MWEQVPRQSCNGVPVPGFPGFAGGNDEPTRSGRKTSACPWSRETDACPWSCRQKALPVPGFRAIPNGGPTKDGARSGTDRAGGPNSEQAYTSERIARLVADFV